GAFTVYELEYTRSNAFPYWSRNFRSVLIEGSAEQFHEIKVECKIEGRVVAPVELLDLEGTQVLHFRNHDGGYYTSFEDSFFLLTASGLEPLDFKTVMYEAVSKAIPKGLEAYDTTSEFDFTNSTWRINTQRRGDGNFKLNCCEGEIEVQFKVVGGR